MPHKNWIQTYSWDVIFDPSMSLYMLESIPGRRKNVCSDFLLIFGLLDFTYLALYVDNLSMQL